MKLNRKLSRRNLLIGGLQAASLVVLSGCEKMFDTLSQNKNVQSLLELAENGSRRAQRLLTRRKHLAKVPRQRQPPADHDGLHYRRAKSLDKVAPRSFRFSETAGEFLTGGSAS